MTLIDTATGATNTGGTAVLSHSGSLYADNAQTTASQHSFAPAATPMLWFLPAVIGISSPAGLTLSIYNNTAAAGAPVSTSVVDTAAASFSEVQAPFSAELTGTLVADGASSTTAATATSTYTFDCDFSTATLA